MTVNEQPIDRLRYHVTGAIERGEKQPIVEVPAFITEGPDTSRFRDHLAELGARAAAAVNEDRPNLGHRYVAVVWCCIDEQWRAVTDIPDTSDSLDEAAQAAEDDVCHWGDRAVVADRLERRVGRIVGGSLTARDIRAALEIADQRATAVPA